MNHDSRNLENSEKPKIYLIVRAEPYEDLIILGYVDMKHKAEAHARCDPRIDIIEVDYYIPTHNP